jgi:hypothetical protein
MIFFPKSTKRRCRPVAKRRARGRDGAFPGSRRTLYTEATACYQCLDYPSISLGETYMADSVQRSKQDWLLGVGLFCFFFSGAAGLIYQVVWTRMLTQIFGNTTYAIATVLSAFMAGLAIGSYVFGRIADRGKNDFLLYGILEAGVGVYGFLVPWLFILAQKAYGPIFGSERKLSFHIQSDSLLPLFRPFGYSDPAHGSDAARVEPVLCTQFRSIRPASRRSLRHQHVRRGDRLRRGRILLGPDLWHALDGFYRRRN